MRLTGDTVYKQPARFSLRLAFPQAAFVAGALIGLVKYTEVHSILWLPIVVFLPVLSIGLFANFTRRCVYILSESEQTLCRLVQWYWFTPRLTECHQFADIEKVSVVRCYGEETFWSVCAIMRDGRSFELTASRNCDKAEQIRQDIERLVGCLENVGDTES